MMYRANLDEADIETRTRKALKKAGYYSLYQLPSDDDELFRLANKLSIGRKGYRDMAQALQQL